MSWILAEQWLWIIILSFIVVLVGPLLLVWFILVLPAELKIVATILIVIAWGVVAGYKDWLQAKRREEEQKMTPSESRPLKSISDAYGVTVTLDEREHAEDKSTDDEQREKES